MPLTVCPTCSHGIKQARGFTWVDVHALVGGNHRGCGDGFPCPICMATQDMGKAGLLWIGTQFYPTPEAFDAEAGKLGISRRIHAIPRNFKVGETWILLAHLKGITAACASCEGVGLKRENGVTFMEVCGACNGERFVITPAIVKVWRPQRIEKILAESQRDSEEHHALEEKGISCVFFPDNDVDHRGSVYDSEEPDDNE